MVLVSVSVRSKGCHVAGTGQAMGQIEGRNGEGAADLEIQVGMVMGEPSGGLRFVPGDMAQRAESVGGDIRTSRL